MEHPGKLTHVAVFAMAFTALYVTGTPEITGNFSESQERGFHVAAIKLIKDEGKARYASYPLSFIKAGKVDSATVSFLLPEDRIERSDIDVPGGDLHQVAVLERHPDWQLVEYRYGNTHDSISKYRAFTDRVDPVSYRVTSHPGLFLGAIVLLFPVWIVSALTNAVWRKVATRRKTVQSK